MTMNHHYAVVTPLLRDITTTACTTKLQKFPYVRDSAGIDSNICIDAMDASSSHAVFARLPGHYRKAIPKNKSFSNVYSGVRSLVLSHYTYSNHFSATIGKSQNSENPGAQAVTQAPVRSSLEETLCLLFYDLLRKEMSDPLFRNLMGMNSIHFGLTDPQQRFPNKSIDEIQNSFVRRILSPKITAASSFLTDWYREQRRADIDQQLWVKLLNVVLEHVKQYKRLRREVFQDNIQNGRKIITQSNEEDLLSPKKSSDFYRHLDEFNEDIIDGLKWDVNENPSVDAFISPSIQIKNNLDEVNAQIVSKMGNLHIALKCSVKDELDYLRSVVNRIWVLLDRTHIDASSNKIGRGFNASAENSFEQHPGLHTSSRILRAHKRLVEQKAVKSFRSLIQSMFTQFPPLFLIDRSKLMNNIEMLLKYSKKVRSIIDVKAIRYQIVHELRKRIEDTSLVSHE
ncbi:hypothetical protein HK096_005131, partial [Nowakowskiella sp. JEL0078]